jgi:hypothetical protein
MEVLVKALVAMLAAVVAQRRAIAVSLAVAQSGLWTRLSGL